MKNQLRKHYKKIRQKYPTYEKHYESYLLQKSIIESSLWQKSQVVALYHPFNEEVDTSLLLKTALKTKKGILFPQILESNHMNMIEYDLKSKLVYNKFGILETEAHSKAFPKKDIDLMIVPALAIDALGYRLGYGGGYYDRYLENQDHIIKIGLIYSLSFSSLLLPTNNKDIPVDYYTTLNGLVKIKK